VILPNPAVLSVPAVPVVPVVGHVALLAVVDATVVVGANELGPTVPTMGNTPNVGTAGAELTPRLLISIEPNGIPVRAAPPGAVGCVDVGLDDAAMLLEPEPHIPDIPDVSSVPGVVDMPVDDIPGIAMVPRSTALAGVADPGAVPPPSKLAVDPNICEGALATVEHAVALLVVGIVIVPVTLVGAGLTPVDAISVAPIGIPVPPTDAPGLLPSGEVALTEGMAVSGSST
jgi:hypothetical protein